MKRLICSVVVLVTFALALSAQADLQPLANVRITKTEPITLKQLKSRVEAYQKQTGVPFTLAQKKEVLDAVINEKLVVQAAQKAGITVTDSEANQFFLQNMAQQLGQEVTEQQLAQIVKEQTGLSLDDFMKAQVGMNVAEYKAYLKSQLIAQRYVMSLKQAEIAAATATDAEIRSYFDMNRASLAQPDVLKMFLVIVPKANNIVGSKARANELLTQVKDKKITYTELKVLSQTPNSDFQAGDMHISKSAQAAQQLGLTYNELLQVFTQSVGTVSSVTETENDFQFHIVQEKTLAKLLELSDLVQPGTTVTVYEYIKANLTQQKQSIVLNNALQSLITDLRKPENYQILKTDTELDKLLSAW